MASEIVAWLGIGVAVLIAARLMWSAARSKREPMLDVTHARVIEWPLPDGTWEAFNSPASKVPSHGTKWLGQTYAIDLAGIEPGVGHARRTDWRSRFWLEPPERFFGFGTLVVAPADATVLSMYDGARDRFACRSWPGLVWFYTAALALAVATAVSRSPSGLSAMLGNHVILDLEDGRFAALAHLQRASITVQPGARLRRGQPIARVGNTGNTTQPHLHLQVMDAADPHGANGVPMAFERYEEREDSGWRVTASAIPKDGIIIRTEQTNAV